MNRFRITVILNAFSAGVNLGAVLVSIAGGNAVWAAASAAIAMLNAAVAINAKPPALSEEPTRHSSWGLGRGR